MKNVKLLSALLVLICAHQAFGGDVSPKRPGDLLPTKWYSTESQMPEWVTVELTHSPGETLQKNDHTTPFEVAADDAPGRVEHKGTRYNEHDNTYTTSLNINTQHCRIAGHGTRTPFGWWTECDNDITYTIYGIARVMCYKAQNSHEGGLM